MTRGLAINNPLNIRISSARWQGMADTQPDPAFVAFRSNEFCIRAGERILLSYQARGLNTIAKMIAAWAPPSDNNPTDAYIANVARACDADKDAPIDVDTVAMAFPMLKAMIRQEQGSDCVPDAVIMDGLRLAGVSDIEPKPIAKSKTMISTVVTGGGAAVAAVSEVHQQVQQAHDTLQEVTDTVSAAAASAGMVHQALHWGITHGAGIAAILVGVGICGIVYAKLNDRKRLGV